MTTLAETPAQVQPARRRFTVYEYHAMAKAGILKKEHRVELIDGEIIDMSPIGNRHLATVDRNTMFWVRAVGEWAIVRIQGSVRLDEWNEPEPDVLLLRRRDDFYESQSAGPADVLLIIEVSHSSLSFDRSVKLPLYARFGIPEVWIANIPSRVIEVYTDPLGGEYTTRRTFRPGQTVSPIAFPDAALPVADVIGQMPEASSQ